MRSIIIAIVSVLLFLTLTVSSLASEQNTGIGISAGWSIAAENDAVEDFSLGVKYRLDTWEAAVDFFRSEFENGGYDKVGVLSVDYTWDFARIPDENFGIYVGTGPSWLAATDYWASDGICWNVLLGYDYTARWSVAGRLFYTLDGGDMFAVGGLTFLF